MPHTKTKEAWFFDELSDQAKEKAREWFRDLDAGDCWFSESVLDDAVTIGDLLGINTRQRSVKLMGGGTRLEPAIYWSGFSHQGQGCVFDGTYEYRKGSKRMIRIHAPQDKELHRIADELAAIQRRNLYHVTANIKGDDRHMSLDIDVCDINQACDAEIVEELIRDFVRWVFKELRAEYDWSTADEQVDENIRANEYEFNQDGTYCR